MSDLALSIVQTHLHWHSPQANRDMFDEHLEDTANSDVIVLPEMFSTGFTMEPRACAEKMDGPTVQWMAGNAKKRDAVICGSVVIQDGDAYYNRFVWMRPDGTYDHYDKRHLFRMAGEHHKYHAGQEVKILEYKGWHICPMVCYDLRFPVWTRSKNDYDLAIFVANWPSPRVNAWDTLLRARAIENVAYVVGVNRIGEDANGKSYLGHSVIVDFLGNPLVDAGEQLSIHTQTLELGPLQQFREKFPVQLDADDFQVTI